jgi:hypothetical protein
MSTLASVTRLSLCAIWLVGCASAQDPLEEEMDGQTPAQQELPPLGEPLTATANTWTWIDFPDSVCDDGTPTGIGVNLSDKSQDLLIFLMGGGACWDYESCVTSSTSTHGPFGSKQFDGTKGLFGLGGILDRKAKSPFAGYNLVFVPYCTGDVHAGDKVTRYEDGAGKMKDFHHKGQPNLVAFLKRLAATVKSPSKLVVSGSSAGGFGAALNYDLIRRYFPKARGYLIDDSGPPMIGEAIPLELHDKWYDAWGLEQTLTPLCPDCKRDFATLVPILAKKYQGDRMALLSNNQDSVIRGFFGQQSAMLFQMNLYAMADQVITPQPNFRYYFTAGTGHTFLFSPGLTTVKGVRLPDWLNKMGSDDADWKSVRP